MSVARVLKEFDIKPIDRITKEEQIVIADNVATIVSNRFNYIDYGYIYTKLMAAKMYIAIIPKGLTRALYMYEEDTLFISDKEDISKVSEELLYECIHAFQDIRNKKGKIKQLGQCMFADYKVYAMALNEASIQYIVSKIIGREDKYVEAYGIKAKTYSYNKYPLICNIIKQLMFFSNEETLVKSTINSTDDFIIDGIENIGFTNYKNIQKNLDDMLYASEEIVGAKRNLDILQFRKDYDAINEQTARIKKIEELIRRLYMDCQMSIFTMYFDKLYNRLETIDDINYYRDRLDNYKELIGFSTDEDQEYFLEYYEKYYDDKEQKLILMEANIKRRDDLALTVATNNPVIQMINKLKNSITRIINRA